MNNNQQISKPTIILKNRLKPYKSIISNWQLYVMLVPVLAYFIIFHYGPMYGLQIAFRDFIATKGFFGSPWVGLQHFERFFNSFYFMRLMKNTIILSVVQLITSMPIAILLAFMINEVKNNHFKKVVQTITYAPHFISYTVLVGMVVIFTNRDYGIVNTVMGLFGGESIDFMKRPEWFRPLYVISGVWQHMGWNAIIYISALAGVDPQLLESADVDGAGRFKKIWHVKLPCILPTIVTMLILNVGNLMNLGYEKTFLMQNSLNVITSDIISTYTYTAGIVGGQYGYSAAVGLFNSVINCVLLIAVNKISRKLQETSLW